MEMKTVKLGDIAEFANGLNFDKSAYKPGIKIIGVSDFKDYSSPQIDSLSEVAVEAIKKSALLHYNDLIFVRSNGNKDLVGRCMIVPKTDMPLLFSGFCIRCRFKDTSKTNPVYYLYYFKSPYFRKILSNTSVGANIQNLSQSRLSRTEVLLPTIQVQNKIASILSAYDDMIDNCKKQISLLEEAAQRLYREWFVDMRFPGHETTPIGDNGYPIGWRETKLDDITSKFATGLNPRKNFVLGKGENYYVTIKNLTQTYVVLDDKCDKVDDEALLKINRRSDLKAGDLLFSGIGTIGRVALVLDTPTNWNISESLFTLRPNDLVSSEYLYLLLLDSGVQGYAQANSQGSAQKGIRMAALKAYSFMLPSDKILKLFDNLIKPYIESLKVNHKMLHNYIEARSHLLPRLISGQIEIKA